MSENSLTRTTVKCLKSVFKTEKQLNFTLALFKKTSSHRTGLLLQRLLKMSHFLKLTCTRFAVLHNRSIESTDRSQLCNYTTHYNCMRHTRGPSDHTIGGFNGDN